MVGWWEGTLKWAWQRHPGGLQYPCALLCQKKTTDLQLVTWPPKTTEYPASSEALLGVWPSPSSRMGKEAICATSRTFSRREKKRLSLCFFLCPFAGKVSSDAGPQSWPLREDDSQFPKGPHYTMQDHTGEHQGWSRGKGSRENCGH